MSKPKLSKVNLTPITDNLKQDYLYVDNEIQSSLKRLNFFKHFKRQSNISKRHGYTIESVVFTLIIWAFLKKSSIKTFCEKCIKAFFPGGKDVLYGIMKSEAINWRKISCSTAKEIYKQNNLSAEQESAFVFDDSIKKRSGKKVEGTSLHFEHSEGRNVVGHQMLELGLSFKNGFLPLDRQIYIGNKRRHLLNEEFKNQKSAVAKDFECASEKNKNEMFREMLARAIRNGFKAVYCLADSWFNSKENIKAVRDKNLVGIFRAKRSKLKYRFNGKNYSLVELYCLLKRRFKKQKNCNWKTVSVVVQLNISDDKKKEEWLDVKLVFSAPKNQKGNQWAAFLSTDTCLKDNEILRIYAMRWSIEVYFKEIKQNMGFLKEQSPSYVSHYASVHLTAIRYMLLFDILLTQGDGTFAELRNTITGKIEMLTFASMLWGLFKAIIYGALDSFKEIVGVKILTEIKNKISCTVEELLEKALQLDENYIAGEIKAKQVGALL
jgi:hypothetical protein